MKKLTGIFMVRKKQFIYAMNVELNFQLGLENVVLVGLGEVLLKKKRKTLIKENLSLLEILQGLFLYHKLWKKPYLKG